MKKAVTWVLLAALVGVAGCISRPVPPDGNMTPALNTTVEPQIPQVYLDAYVESFFTIFGVEKVDDTPRLTQQKAKSLGRKYLESLEGPTFHNPDLLQAVLVRYTADPNYFEYGKLSWFLVVIPDMSLVPFQGGPPPADYYPIPTSLAYPLQAWPPIFAVFMDDATGQFWGGSYENQRQLISVDPNQKEKLDSYVSKYGWWPVWYQTHGKKVITDSVVDGLQPPDKLLGN